MSTIIYKRLGYTFLLPSRTISLLLGSPPRAPALGGSGEWGTSLPREGRLCSMPHPEGDRTSSVLGVRRSRAYGMRKGGHETRRSSVHGMRRPSGQSPRASGVSTPPITAPRASTLAPPAWSAQEPQHHREALTPCLGLMESVVTSHPSAQRGVYWEPWTLL